MPVINPNAWTTFENGTFEAPSAIILYPTASYNVLSWNNHEILELNTVTFFQGLQSLRIRSKEFSTSPGISSTERVLIDIFPRNAGTQDNSYRLVGKLYGQIINAQPTDTFRLYARYAGANVLVKEISQANFNTWQDIDVTFLAASSPSADFNAMQFYIKYDDYERANGLPLRKIEFYIDGVTLEESTPDPDPFTASFTKTDVTVTGGADGTITLNITGGSGNFSYLWNDAAIIKNRTNLAAGVYTVTITDDETLQDETLEIQINEPAPVQDTVTPYFEVPKNQSVTFVIPQSIDNCSIFQTFDNTLFCEQKHPFYKGLRYYQKFDICDSFKVQFRSNLDSHVCKLFRETDDAEIETYVPELKVQLVGNEETFNVRLQDNGANQTRVYFVGETTIPVPVDVDDQFEILNNADGFNGVYTIVAIDTDIVTSEQYLVINKTYGLGVASSNALAKFIQNTVDFNIWEFNVNFQSVPAGRYYMKITATNNVDYTEEAKSEPIHIQEHHENTIFIEWTNIDNAFDIDYSTNITHRIRVEAVLFDRLPAADQVGLRSTSGSYNLLSSKPRRRAKINFYNLPPYMHEKLFLAFQCDVARVNSIDVTSEEGLEEPIYRTRFGLSNSSITVEQKVWFGSYNTNDLGGVDVPGTGFIIANEGFIKR